MLYDTTNIDVYLYCKYGVYAYIYGVYDSVEELDATNLQIGRTLRKKMYTVQASTYDARV